MSNFPHSELATNAKLLAPNRIAVSLTCQHWSELLTAVTVATANAADLIEIRLDYLTDRQVLTETADILSQLRQQTSKPLIFTYRQQKPEPVPNRTAQNISRLITTRYAQPQATLATDFIDFDLHTESTASLHIYQTYLRIFHQYPQIILSYHDFNHCSREDLQATYQRLSVFTPDVIKLAATATRLTDNQIIWELLATAAADNQPLIALAMGEAGQLSRILGTSHAGNYLTFAALNAGQEAAPGQLPLATLRDHYHLPQLTATTPVYALLGDPVGHSLSPILHNAAFAATQTSGVYLPLRIPATDLSDFLSAMFHPRTRQHSVPFAGASVTVPHKVAVQANVDHLDISAQQVGAVNTLVVRDGQLWGYNTDLIAAIQPITQHFGANLAGLQAVVLGNGGAARAVIAGLVAAKAQVTVYGRNKDKNAQLAAQFGIATQPWAASASAQGDLLVNATPLGMHGWSTPATLPLPAESLSRFKVIYDLIYNPLMTPLLQAAQQQGCQIISGLEMFLAQAAAQFELWTAKPAPLTVMRALAEEKLSENLQR
jgi:3-dehydroquinate dehydratase/shikimate dehydrogenase